MRRILAALIPLAFVVALATGCDDGCGEGKETGIIGWTVGPKGSVSPVYGCKDK